MKALLAKYRGNLPLILLGASLLSLAGAFVAEYGFDLKPCELCLLQRIPFAVVIALSFTALLCGKKPKLQTALLYLCAATFAVGGSIAIFHVGVEQHWWEGLSGCSSTGIATTLEELRAQIFAAPTVRCDEPAFVFLGISMAGYNVLWSFFLAAITFFSLQGTAHGKKK